MTVHQKRIKLMLEHQEVHEALQFYLTMPNELVEIHYQFYFTPAGCHGLTEHQLSQIHCEEV